VRRVDGDPHYQPYHLAAGPQEPRMAEPCIASDVSEPRGIYQVLEAPLRRSDQRGSDDTDEGGSVEVDGRRAYRIQKAVSSAYPTAAGSDSDSDSPSFPAAQPFDITSKCHRTACAGGAEETQKASASASAV